MANFSADLAGAAVCPALTPSVTSSMNHANLEIFWDTMNGRCLIFPHYIQGISAIVLPGDGGDQH
jgi:hypothetical protein